MQTSPRRFIILCACLSSLLLLGGCSSLFGNGRAATYTDPATGMEFVLVPGGCYRMGNLQGGADSDEEPAHQVCLDDFYLGKTEVTQAQWLKMTGRNPSHFQKGDDHPVESVSWNEAMAFLKKMSAAGAKPYRLPTEAEWEYACRSGGKEETFCGGDTLDSLAWFDRTGGGSTQAVATRQPNGLGLFDMSGNVWEFCSDTYAQDYYATSPDRNPQGAAEGPHIVKRGGSWSINPRYLRATVRGRAARDDAHYSSGFRVAVSATF